MGDVWDLLVDPVLVGVSWGSPDGSPEQKRSERTLLGGNGNGTAPSGNGNMKSGNSNAAVTVTHL